jgi:serine/threonine protein kinase
MKIPENIQWQSTGKSLGSGGQANVYLVTRREQPDGIKYALKVLKNVSSIQAKGRFLREISAVKMLNSPLIARIFDHSQPEDDFQYYAMEYYEGARTLANIIFSGFNPYYGNVIKCLDIFEKLILAIRICEQANPRIIHRDINPKNILVLPDESLRLIDFGICQIDDGQILTLTDEDVGTRNYTAPECEAGSEAQIGVHSDIYSAAKVLWSTMTSQRCFAREKPVFSNKCMKAIFPDLPLSWHLDNIYYHSIRSNIENRFGYTESMLNLIKETRYLVERQFPTLTEVSQRCPSCGYPSVGQYDQGHSVFGNPNPQDVYSLICNHCGLIFLRNVGVLRQEYERYSTAE